MFKYIIELIKIANNKDKEILKLRGMLDCANGNAARLDNQVYLEGYARQYAEEQQRTAEAMGSL